MDILFTALALVILVGCVACVWLCVLNRQACAEYEEHLRRSIGRIAALEAGFDSLSTQHAKLRGKFYATQAPVAERDNVELAQVIDRERLRKEHASRMMPPGVNRGA